MITSIGAAGIVGLAGCSGDGDGGDTQTRTTGGDTGSVDSDVRQLTMRTANEETLIFAMGQGMAAVINEFSDRINLNVVPSESNKASMAFLNAGEADFAATDIMNANRIVNRSGDYAQNWDTNIRRMFHTYLVQFNLYGAGSDINSITDLKGKTVSVGPVPGNSAKILRSQAGYVLDDDEWDPIGLAHSEEPNALQSGRIVAACGLRVNDTIRPSYDQKQTQLNPDQKLLTWPEEAVSQIEEDSALAGQYYTSEQMSDPDGWTEDEHWWPLSPFHSYTSAELDPGIVNEFMSVLYDNSEELASYHPVLKQMVDSEFTYWRRHSPEFTSLHPGAEEFYSNNSIESQS